jgi:hypothetical protein
MELPEVKIAYLECTDILEREQRDSSVEWEFLVPCHRVRSMIWG